MKNKRNVKYIPFEKALMRDWDCSLNRNEYIYFVVSSLNRNFALKK